MRGIPAQTGFINGVPGYISGCKKGIYTENEWSHFWSAISENNRYKGNPCSNLISKGLLLLLWPSPQCQIFFLSVIGSLENN